MQEIPTPQTMSNPNHNSRGAPIIMLGISAPGFGDSSGYQGEKPSDNPTKDPYVVPIINPASVISENSTKDTSHVPK